MPYLICSSPTLLDHSFPRNSDELTDVAYTLGQIQLQLTQNEVILILTDGLRAIIEDFNWDQPQCPPKKREIYNLLCQWFLNKHDRLVIIDTSEITIFNKHPIPQNCISQGLVDLWSEEVGKLLEFHDVYYSGRGFLIGITCESAYCNGELNCYINPNSIRCFPLVGPCNINMLEDAYDWDVSIDIQRQTITINDVKRNYRAINSYACEKPVRDSHYKLKFKNSRSWTFDAHMPEVPEKFLNELEPITGYPHKVIKYALKFGKLPKKIPKIRQLPNII